MGYSCPVCETPQHDSEHLANHLAMTAMLHEADHEAWLDEHVEGWAEFTPPELGKRVVDAAEPVDYDEAAVDAADIPEEFRSEGEDGNQQHDHAGSNQHDHAGSNQHDQGTVPETGGIDESAVQGADQLDEETEEVLAEARELTKKRRERAAEAEEDTDGDGAGEDANSDGSEAGDAADGDEAGEDTDGGGASDDAGSDAE